MRAAMRTKPYRMHNHAVGILRMKFILCTFGAYRCASRERLSSTILVKLSSRRSVETANIEDFSLKQPV